MDDAVQRFEGQLTRLSSLLTSASSCCAFAVGEERTLAAQLDRMHIATQTALAEFGESVHESCFNDLMFAELCRWKEDGFQPAGCDMAVVSRILLIDKLKSSTTSNLGGYLVLGDGSLGGAFHTGHTYEDAASGCAVRVVPALDWNVDVPEELLDEEGEDYDLEEARLYAEEVGDHYREAWEQHWVD